MRPAPAAPRWALTLYVNGASPLSAAAIDSIRRICDEDLAGNVDLEIVDVSQHPLLMMRDHVVAAPTLVKRLPEPLRYLIGDLADAARVRQGLDLSPVVPEDA